MVYLLVLFLFFLKGWDEISSSHTPQRCILISPCTSAPLPSEEKWKCYYRQSAVWVALMEERCGGD